MAVQVSIHEFNIYKKMVSDGQHGLQCLPGCQQTGLNGGIRAGILAQLKDFRSKLPLHQHFTAGQGNAAVFSEKDLIPQKGIRGFPGGGSFAVNRHSCRGTGIHTNSALVAGTVIHMDPVRINDPETDRLKELVEAYLAEISTDLSLHDFRIVTGPTHTNIIFDIVTPYGFPMTDKELVEQLTSMIRTENPNYYAVIEVDKTYSGI